MPDWPERHAETGIFPQLSGHLTNPVVQANCWASTRTISLARSSGVSMTNTTKVNTATQTSGTNRKSTRIIMAQIPTLSGANHKDQALTWN